MEDKIKLERIQSLTARMSEQQRQQFELVISNRTKYMTIVLEDLFQPQNASAVIRTCENLGIIDIHAIEMRNKFILDEQVSNGASRWINLSHYNTPDTNNTEVCLKKLKEQGYKIVATTPAPDKTSYNLEDLPVNSKLALMFGTEKKGLTDFAINNSDQFMKIPMYGFTESLNISVCLAISVFYLMEKIRNSDINWRLNESEALDLKFKMLENLFPEPVN